MKNMFKGKRVGVTGHTSGIGKEIYEYCMHHGADVRGYSRSNGFNMKDREGDHIINDLLRWDCDIFFNHAWYPRVQGKLLKILYKQWEKKEKIIINTGSASAYYAVGASIYESDKTELRDFCIARAIQYPHANKCRIHNVSMGWTNSRYLTNVEDEKYWIDPYEAALVLMNLAQPQNYMMTEVLCNSMYKPMEDMIKLKDVATANVVMDLQK